MELVIAKADSGFVALVVVYRSRRGFIVSVENPSLDEFTMLILVDIREL